MTKVFERRKYEIPEWFLPNSLVTWDDWDTQVNMNGMVVSLDYNEWDKEYKHGLFTLNVLTGSGLRSFSLSCSSGYDWSEFGETGNNMIYPL